MTSQNSISKACGALCQPGTIDWANITLTEDMRHTLNVVKSQKINEKVSVYEGFGSFHSENVEDLIAAKEADYVTPRNFPTFAKKILTNDQLRRLAFLHWHSDTAGSNRKSSQKPHNRFKRSRSAESTGTSARSNDNGSKPDSVAGGYPASARPMTPAAPLCTPGEHDSASSGMAESDDGASGDEDCSDPSHTTFNDISAPNELQLRYASESMEVCSMGREFREKHFMITPNVVFINHGAFGSALAGAVAIKRQFEEMQEGEVVEFVDRELLPLIVHSIRCLSRFLKADPRQVVLLQNATFALNCAMQLIEKDDVVAYLDTEYLSVYKMMWFRCQEVGATHHELAISRFLHDDKVMGDDAALTDEIMRQLPEGCTTVVIDCITSTSALLLPIFSHIVPALRRRGVTKIIVDGAHSPLQVNLDFSSLPPESQPTVFVGNLHKWFSSPKSVGFFWVRAEDAENIHSVVLSHGAGDGLLSEFIWDGTRDYGAYLSVPAIVDFWESQGCDRVREYCTSLVHSSAAMLTAAFRSRPVPRSAPFMTLVELPEELQDSYVTAKYIQDLLHDVYRIEVPVKRIEGRYYLRISAFVYNTPQEYVYLKEAVLDIADRWFHSEERRALAIEAANASAHPSTSAVAADAGKAAPCDERIRRQGGCGVSGLDPSLKRKKTKKF